MTDPRNLVVLTHAMLRSQEKFAEYLGKGDVELQAFSTFLVVAATAKDLPMQELQEILGLSQASVSRNIALLSIGSVANPNPRLVEAVEDSAHRRRKVVRLTGKGRKLVDELYGIWGGFCKKIA